MKEPVYRWNGEYFGFIYNERLFDKYSKYLGWLDNKDVWKSDGTFLGEITEEHYILRRVNMAARARRAIRATPATPSIPSFKSNKSARAVRSGTVDALDDFM